MGWGGGGWGLGVIHTMLSSPSGDMTVCLVPRTKYFCPINLSSVNVSFQTCNVAVPGKKVHMFYITSSTI